MSSFTFSLSSTMVNLRCLVVLVTLHVFSRSASIPVKVVYDRHDMESFGARNLQENRQVNTEEVAGNSREVVSSTARIVGPTDFSNPLEKLENQEYSIKNINGLRNLQTKVQLSEDDLAQASKHLPLVMETTQTGTILNENMATPKAIEEYENKKVLNKEKIVTPNGSDHQVLHPSVHTNQLSSPLLHPFNSAAEVLPDDNWHSYLILQQAQEIVNNGLSTLRKSADDSMVQNSMDIENLKRRIEFHLNSLKQDAPNNQNLLQNIITGLSNITGNFVQSIQNNNNNGGTGTQGDEQRPSIGQNFISTIQGKTFLLSSYLSIKGARTLFKTCEDNVQSSESL